MVRPIIEKSNLILELEINDVFVAIRGSVSDGMIIDTAISCGKNYYLYMFCEFKHLQQSY
jgi:hypothetical protein